MSTRPSRAITGASSCSGIRGGAAVARDDRASAEAPDPDIETGARRPRVRWRETRKSAQLLRSSAVAASSKAVVFVDGNATAAAVHHRCITRTPSGGPRRHRPPAEQPFPCGLAVLAVAATALATPSSGFSTEQLSPGRFGEIDARAETDSFELELKTKGEATPTSTSSGTRCCPEASPVGTTTRARASSQSFKGPQPSTTPTIRPARRGCSRRARAIVDDSVDASHVHLLRNEGTGNVVTVTTQIVPAGASRRIDAPDPGNCDF